MGLGDGGIPEGQQGSGCFSWDTVPTIMVLSISFRARCRQTVIHWSLPIRLTLSSVKWGQWQLGAHMDITKYFLALAVTAIVLGHS